MKQKYETPALTVVALGTVNILMTSTVRKTGVSSIARSTI